MIHAFRLNLQIIRDLKLFYSTVVKRINKNHHQINKSTYFNKLSKVSKFLLISSSFLLFLPSNRVICDNSDVPGDNIFKSDLIEKLIRQVYPLIQPLGISSLAGFASGLAFHKLGEQAVYYCGVVFIIIQTLAHYDIIRVDYKKLTEEAKKVLDVDHNDKIDVQDVLAIYRKIKEFLSKQLPSASAFATGFAFGLYYG